MTTYTPQLRVSCAEWCLFCCRGLEKKPIPVYNDVDDEVSPTDRTDAQRLTYIKWVLDQLFTSAVCMPLHLCWHDAACNPSNDCLKQEEKGLQVSHHDMQTICWCGAAEPCGSKLAAVFAES